MSLMGGLVKAVSERPQQPEKKPRGRPSPGRAIAVICFACFLLAFVFSRPVSFLPSEKKTRFVYSSSSSSSSSSCESSMPRSSQDCENRTRSGKANPRDIIREVSKTHQAIRSLDKSISSLEMELAVARMNSNGGSSSSGHGKGLKKAFAVIGINTGFSSKKRRESVRQTWMPRGTKLKRLEEEKSVVVRFMIGHSATPGGALDRAIDAEDEETKDFLRLDHLEGYHELSSKTRVYFATAVAIWDADFYLKVDDDVHVNLGILTTNLARYRGKSRVYMGCMKSGPVLFQTGVKYHEPEHWKFGEEGNKYFRHATGQIYAISKDLALYISTNAPILHKYANEDVSLGSWLIGLEVEHIDDRSMCCGTPPDCEWKTRSGNVCIASFDWSCSGVCKSVDRMKDVHSSCGESDAAIWDVVL